MHSNTPALIAWQIRLYWILVSSTLAQDILRIVYSVVLSVVYQLQKHLHNIDLVVESEAWCCFTWAARAVPRCLHYTHAFLASTIRIRTTDVSRYMAGILYPSKI